MRINEVIKPIKAIQPSQTTKPMTPAKARVNALQQSVERSRQQLTAERDRQQQQRDVERKQKLQQQLSNITKSQLKK